MEEEERLNEHIPDSVIIQYLLREKKQLLIELGQEKAYTSELEDLLKEEKAKSSDLRDATKEAKKELKKDAVHNQMKIQIRNLEKSKKELTILRDHLMYKISKYEKILKENNLL